MASISTTPSLIDPATLPAPYNNKAADCVLFLSSHILIHASARAAFEVLADPTKYHEWNSFARQAEIVKSPNASGESDLNDAHGGIPKPNAEALGLTALREGDRITLHVRMKPSDSSLQQTELQVRTINNFPPTGRELCSARMQEISEEMSMEPRGKKKTFRLVWTSERWGLHAERIMELRETDAPDGEGEDWCEFRTWEMMNGLLSRVVKPMFGAVLQERFLDWAKDLKAEAEKQAGEAQC